jgi:hypothetical protein
MNPTIYQTILQRQHTLMAATALGLAMQLGSASCLAREHLIDPNRFTDPQEVFDNASPGDRIVFLPGVHQHPLSRHRSLLYVDKSIDIEFRSGATLKLADNQTRLEEKPQITIDHGAVKNINDLHVGGRYDQSLGKLDYTVQIDGTTDDGKTDTFSWCSGSLFKFTHKLVPITGEWQELEHGVKIRFDAMSGHNRGSLWFISYDGPESYGIRIGHGFQPDYIDGVRIFGPGTIDLNGLHNVTPSGLVPNINACVLVHGRVRNVSIEDITMTDTNRSVMLYGEHSGKFERGGGTTPGESFDAEDISIQYTRTLNPNGSGYLLGHPSHRGHLRRVRCNYNYMVTASTSMEPNFQLDQYELIGNLIKSDGKAIHCWRKSINGVIADNLRIDDVEKRDVVILGAPSAWEHPENITLKNNRNHLGDRVDAIPMWEQVRP